MSQRAELVNILRGHVSTNDAQKIATAVFGNNDVDKTTELIKEILGE